MLDDIKKVTLVVFFWALAILYFWRLDKQNKITMAIEADGIEVPAKILERHYAKGWIMKVEYHYGGKRYTYDTNISEFIPEVGDSLMIKVLPAEPGKFIIVVKEKAFSTSRKSRSN